MIEFNRKKKTLSKRDTFSFISFIYTHVFLLTKSFQQILSFFFFIDLIIFTMILMFEINNWRLSFFYVNVLTVAWILVLHMGQFWSEKLHSRQAAKWAQGKNIMFLTLSKQTTHKRSFFNRSFSSLSWAVSALVVSSSEEVESSISWSLVEALEALAATCFSSLETSGLGTGSGPRDKFRGAAGLSDELDTFVWLPLESGRSRSGLILSSISCQLVLMTTSSGLASWPLWSTWDGSFTLKSGGTNLLDRILYIFFFFFFSNTWKFFAV